MVSSKRRSSFGRRNQKMTDEKIMVKGVFINSTLDEIQKKGSEKEIESLKEKIGSLKLSPFKSYPVFIQKEAERALCQILYGHDDENANFEFGKKSFRSFAESNIGKVMLALFGKDSKALVCNIERLYNTVTSGIEIEVKELEEKKYSVRFYNDPYDLRGTEGVLAGGLEYLGIDANVKFINHGKNDHEFILKWA